MEEIFISEVQLVTRMLLAKSMPRLAFVVWGLVGGLSTAALSVPAIASESAAADQGLDTITVVATGVSNMSAASAGDVGTVEIMSEPLLRPAAILENVPGLLVTQHSGEGKANQYFLRGFNLDHGTDLAIEVDDMPVNMPTHAHGQGYADLNFVIPEAAAYLHYKKGPYFADEGDFATAGSARVGLANELPLGVTAGLGQNGYQRALLTASIALFGGTLIGAGEAYRNDGPFDVPDNYHRLNAEVRYFRGSDMDYFSLTAMAYSGRWNATDQVAQRAITEGLLDRFGSLNPTDGGNSSRSSLSFSRIKRTDDGQLQVSGYVMRYKLDLWSTFTYYLSDPIDGDQMLQHDDRVAYGIKASKTWFASILGAPTTTLIGAQARFDDIKDVGIFSTVDRATIGTTQNAGVLESSAALYAESNTRWLDYLQTTIGLRRDQFYFDVKDKMLNADGSCNLNSDPLGCDTGKKRASILSPKLGIVLGPWAKTRYFINIGDGYHSNDARGTTRSGQDSGQTPVTPLTRAAGGEAGMATQIVTNLDTRIDVFELKLRSELVFDGDAGVTSPSGATTRTGIEWGNAYRINGWLAADFDTAFTRARFDRESPPDGLGCVQASPAYPCTRPIAVTGRHIPNSPTNVTDAGLSAGRESGWFGALRARHFGESPLVEDDSAKSSAYTTVDARIGYRRSNQWLIALDVFNVADVKWNDIEYYYVSRLRYESSPRADYMLHPGVPRTLRLRFQCRL